MYALEVAAQEWTVTQYRLLIRLPLRSVGRAYKCKEKDAPGESPEVAVSALIPHNHGFLDYAGR